MKNISGWLQQQQHGGAEQRDAEPGERDEGPERHRHAAPVPARHPHPVLDTCHTTRVTWPNIVRWRMRVLQFFNSSTEQRGECCGSRWRAAAADSDQILYSMEHFRYLYREAVLHKSFISLTMQLFRAFWTKAPAENWAGVYNDFP